MILPVQISGEHLPLANYTTSEDTPKTVVNGRNSLQLNPGTTLTVNNSVIRIWECLRFTSRFMRTFGDVEEVMVRCQFAGLSGRTLIDSTDPAFSIRRGVSRVNEVLLSGQFTRQQLEDNMPEVLRRLMAPLFEHFDFFELTVAHVQNIIDRYRERWPW